MENSNMFNIWFIRMCKDYDCKSSEILYEIEKLEGLQQIDHFDQVAEIFDIPLREQSIRDWLWDRFCQKFREITPYSHYYGLNGIMGKYRV